MSDRTATLAPEKNPLAVRSELQPHAAVKPVAGQSLHAPASSFSHDLSQFPASAESRSLSCGAFPRTCPFGGACHTCPSHVQRKPAISEPGDEYEREADRVAERVMRMPAPEEDEDKPCSRPGCAGTVQRQAAGNSPASPLPQQGGGREGRSAAGGIPAVVAGALRSPGRPLDAATRAYMEPRFGQDFGNVRIHTDVRAAESARAVNALAYTVGHDIVFSAGRYAPGAAEGSRLVAHELAHTIQAVRFPTQGPWIARQTPPAPPSPSPAQTAPLKPAPPPTPTPTAEEPLKFKYKAGLDSELQARFNRMVIALDKKGIKYGTIDDVRPKARAHILSTGYHIREKEAVTLKDLRALTGGRDLDGNAWYKKEWEQVSTYFGLGDPRAATDVEIQDSAKANAYALVKNEGSDYISSGKINCAYEGYPADDAHRLPNIAKVPMSNHVVGRAIDLSGIEWAKLGGQWSDDARKFVASFGLTRPYSPEADTYCIKEHWHFELG